MVDESIGFGSHGLKGIVVTHVLSNLLDRQLDQHTSNLWHSLLGSELLDVLENGLSNSLLVVFAGLDQRK